MASAFRVFLESNGWRIIFADDGGVYGKFFTGTRCRNTAPLSSFQKYDITFAAAFASIIMERLFDMIILLLIFIWVFWFEADAFSSNIEFSGFSVQEMAIKFGQICVLAVIALMVFIYLLLNHKKKVMKIVGWLLGFMNEKWADKIKYLFDEFTMGCEVVKSFGALAKISVYSALVWVANIFWVYPLYFAFDLQYKTIPSLLILGVMVAILISILPTPGFLGSYNAGIVIALHEVMGESEIKSVSLGMVGWALFSGAILAGGLYFIFHEHMSLKDLASAKRERDTSVTI